MGANVVAIFTRYFGRVRFAVTRWHTYVRFSHVITAIVLDVRAWKDVGEERFYGTSRIIT